MVVRAVNRLFIILLFTICYATVHLCAQNGNTEHMGYGVWGHAVLALHTADFDSLPGIPQARTRFTSGTGFGVAAGVQLHIPLAPLWSVSLRTGATVYTGHFSEVQQESVVGIPQPFATIRHTVDASFAMLTAAPLLSYTAWKNLHLMAGPEIGLLLSGTAIQRETIEDPPGATWVESGTASKELFNGSLGNPTRFQLAVALGAGYNIPLTSSQSLVLVPEITASLPLGTLYGTESWSSASYKAGMSLLFTPQPTPLPIVRDTLYLRDTTARIVAALDTENIALDSAQIFTEHLRSLNNVLYRTTIREHYVRNIPELKPLLSATIKASFVLENGEEAQAAKVTMEEFIVNKYVPLLPYVFFDKGQAYLPPRYKRIAPEQAETFDIHQQHHIEALDAYYQVLDILGQRMRAHPNAALFITGCTALEDDAPTLAAQRALSVAQYLSENWHIPASRLHTAARGIPEKPSNMAQPEGVEENRRVEFSSTEPQLFAPVVLTDTIRTVDPPTVRFHRRLFTEAGIRHWSIIIMQRSNTLKIIQGKGTPPAIVDWSIGSDDIRPAASQPLEYVFAVVDSTGQSFTTPPSSILFEQLTIQKKQVERRADKIIDRFSLLLFNYNEAQLSPYHATTMQFIQSKLAASSTVKIVGTTDRLGEEQYNKQLSEMRARETARALSLSNATITGLGEDSTTYSNDLPEGRFYSRTVRIFIETPVEAKKN